MDTIKNNWSAALTISKVLLTIMQLLSEPNPADPLVKPIAHEMLTSPETYFKTAQEWTKKYASPELTEAKCPVCNKHANCVSHLVVLLLLRHFVLGLSSLLQVNARDKSYAAAVVEQRHDHANQRSAAHQDEAGGEGIGGEIPSGLLRHFLAMNPMSNHPLPFSSQRRRADEGTSSYPGACIPRARRSSGPRVRDLHRTWRTFPSDEDAVGDSNVLEVDERGETLNVVELGESVVGSGIHLRVVTQRRGYLGDIDLSIHLVGKILPHGGQLLAMTAPLQDQGEGIQDCTGA